MIYLIEQTKWENGYYHLVNSEIFESNKNCERSYYKNGSYFNIIRLNDEIQTARRYKTRNHNK